MKRFFAYFPILTLIFSGCASSNYDEEEQEYKPNILWIVAEDMSPNWSCYGETTIQTPNIDKLASEGELFENAFVTSPVCSPSRSAMVTGMYPISIGAHNHRSQIEEGKGGGNEPYFSSFQLPDEIPFLPRIFKEEGYFTVLGTGESILTESDAHEKGKTDYNFEFDPSLYDSNDWDERKPGQPFFAQIQLKGGKYRNARVENPVNPDEVELPPYYPNDEVLREDWAEYLNSVLYLDKEVKEIMSRLEEEGIADSTIVFLWTDHGISHLRSKQFLYDDGIKVPLIVRWPGIIPSGERREDMVMQIDISATSLDLAGLNVPQNMQGRSFYAEDYEPDDYIFAARDRCDETVDLIRAVRTKDMKYIRNFFPHKPHAQPNTYKDKKIIVQHMRQLYKEGKLKEETTRYFHPSRPAEELYDLEKDPDEMNNLAQDPAYRDSLVKMRKMLDSTILNVHDLGFIPEPILEELGKKYGNKYFILQHEENKDLIKDCKEVIEMDEEGNMDGLKEALSDERASVRFWAAYGLGNYPELSAGAIPLLQETLKDTSDAVKIAAARALCRNDITDPSLQILASNLENKNLLVTLYAALFIEDLKEELIRKVLPEIQEAQEGPYEFTRRVANRLNKKYGS